MDYKEKVIALLNSKELSQEQKEKLESTFPELKESEDERIRKAIIKCLKWLRDEARWTDIYGISFDSIFAWLEKQGEHQQFNDNFPSFDDAQGTVIVEKHGGQKSKFRVGDTIKCKYDDRQFTIKRVDLDKGTYTYIQEGCGNDIDYADEEFELVEKKPTDKVEPKFKVGDWISNDMCDAHIASIENGMYYFDEGDGLSIVFVDEHYHLWTIEDAMDGDVLATSAGAFIYNGNNGGGSCPGSYCGIDNLGELKTGVEHHWTGKKVYPATIEQRNLLFQKIHEAGYMLDSESKQLLSLKAEPIEPDDLIKESYQQQADDLIDMVTEKPAWSEEDEKVLHAIRNALNYEKPRNYLKSRDFEFTDILDWLKSLKDRAQSQPKQEWSEEDESILQGIWDEILANKHDAKEYEWKTYDKFLNWLKSLKPQSTWKPSDEQMEILQYLCETSSHPNEKVIPTLKSLYQDLKKLKG